MPAEASAVDERDAALQVAARGAGVEAERDARADLGAVAQLGTGDAPVAAVVVHRLAAGDVERAGVRAGEPGRAVEAEGLAVRTAEVGAVAVLAGGDEAVAAEERLARARAAGAGHPAHVASVGLLLAVARRGLLREQAPTVLDVAGETTGTHRTVGTEVRRRCVASRAQHAHAPPGSTPTIDGNMMRWTIGGSHCLRSMVLAHFPSCRRRS